MIPRALRSRPRAMARPARPASEISAVRIGADIARSETGLTSAAPLAIAVATRVVEEMQTHLAETMDPFLAALGDARRRADPSPFAFLATDPDVDSFRLFVDARVERLRARYGRGLSAREDEAECRDLWSEVARKLARRYMNALR